MRTVRCSPLPNHFLCLQSHHFHETRDSFPVDRPALLPQFHSHSPIAIARKLRTHVFHGCVQFLVWHDTGSAIQVATSHAKHSAHHCFWVLFAHLPAQLLLGGFVWGKSVKAFFATSNSRLSLPAKRSSSSIRACCGSTFVSLSNTWDALARNWFFQCETRSGFRLYSRQISAVVLLPLMISSTTFVLNSALKFLLVRAILHSFLNTVYLVFALCLI